MTGVERSPHIEVEIISNLQHAPTQQIEGRTHRNREEVHPHQETNKWFELETKSTTSLPIPTESFDMLVVGVEFPCKC